MSEGTREERREKALFLLVQVLPLLFGLGGFVGVNQLLGTDSTVMVNISTFIKTLAPPLFSLLQEVQYNFNDVYIKLYSVTAPCLYSP